MLGVLFILTTASLLWGAALGRFAWSQLVLVLLIGLVYLMSQRVGGDGFSMTQKVRFSLVATWVLVVAFVMFSAYMVLRADNEFSSDGRAVVGIAAMFGGFGLIGLIAAVLYTRQLLRLLRDSESEAP